MHALSRAITRFIDEAPDGEPRCSFNFGVIEGGTSINAIPSEARAKVDLRSESARRIDEMAALLTAGVEKTLEEENARASHCRGRPAWRRAGEGDRLAAGRDVCGRARRFSNTCWPWMRTWASAARSTVPRPTPIFLSPWDFRRCRSGRAGKAAARTPRRSGFSRRAGNWDCGGSCWRCACCWADDVLAETVSAAEAVCTRLRMPVYYGWEAGS